MAVADLATESPGASRGEGLERRNRAVGIRIDPDTCRPRSAGDRLDYGLAVELLLARALSPT